MSFTKDHVLSLLTNSRFNAASMDPASNEKEYVAIGREVALRNGDDFEPRTFMNWLTKGQNDGSLMGVEMRNDEGHLTGLLVCSIKPGKDRGEIDLVWTDPGIRRHGVGSELMHVAEHGLKQAGAKEINLWVGNQNGDAQRVYEKLGWERVGTSPTHVQFARPLANLKL